MIKEFEPPAGWGSKSLSDLLTDNQIKEVTKIINQNLNDTDQMVRALKAFLIPLRNQLLEKEMVPEYLAYAIAHAVIENGKHN